MRCCLEFTKDFKDFGSVFGLYTNTRICDFSKELRLASLTIKGYATKDGNVSMKCELEGISNEVNQYLFNTLDVESEFLGDLIINFQQKLKTLLIGL